MRATLRHSYAYCERLSRQQARHFYPAFCLLPRRQRQAMCALYAFLRIADDLSDAPGEPAAKRRALEHWRQGLHRACQGEYSHPIHAALHDSLVRYAIPVRYLEEALEGVLCDLTPTLYRSFAELRRYCYHVASAVGLACLPIWGCTAPAAAGYAEQAGIAFQLTNILRDLGEDADRGRIYLPQEELQQFGYSVDALQRREYTDAFRALMRFQVARARQFYESAWPLAALLPAPGRAVFLLMARTYQGLLDRIEACGYDVFRRHIRLRWWQQGWLLARVLPVRWGVL